MINIRMILNWFVMIMVYDNLNESAFMDQNLLLLQARFLPGSGFTRDTPFPAKLFCQCFSATWTLYSSIDVESDHVPGVGLPSIRRLPRSDITKSNFAFSSSPGAVSHLEGDQGPAAGAQLVGVAGAVGLVDNFESTSPAGTIGIDGSLPVIAGSWIGSWLESEGLSGADVVEVGGAEISLSDVEGGESSQVSSSLRSGHGLQVHQVEGLRSSVGSEGLIKQVDENVGGSLVLNLVSGMRSGTHFK